MLPIPSPEQQTRSAQLTAHILQKIAAAPQHYISFADYMELALYTPDLGYYMADHPVFGWTGDFTTAPELSALFGQCVARPVEQVLRTLGGDILEIGAGSGKLARDILHYLSELNLLPEHYYILEISPALRHRQQQYLQEHFPSFYERIIWLDVLPAHFTGIILANEVIDALPAECFTIKEQGIFTRGVTEKNQQLQWIDYPALPALKTAVENFQKNISDPLYPGYVSEVQTILPAWIKNISDCLTRGVVLLIDYGFSRQEYYHPQRNQGTLMCHYRQHAHSDPFWYPGLQDITVHADFSAVAEAAYSQGLEVIGFTSQAHFLLDCGLIDILQSQPDLSFADKHQVQILTSPAEMGELFKVMGLARDYDLPVTGFSGRSRAF